MRLDAAWPTPVTRTRRDFAISAIVLIIAVVAIGSIAVRLGADGNGDLRNYHYYGGWALFHKHVGFDLAPGQMQTYHHPLLDAIFYLVSSRLNSYPLVFTFVWAVPQAVAVWLAFHIALLCFEEVRGRLVLAAAAALIGAGGAASIAVVGTSMSEGVLNVLLLGAIWLVLTADRQARAGQPIALRYAGAGLLAGAAAVLKLSTMPSLLGFGGAILGMKLLDPRLPRLRGLVLFGVGAAISLLVLGGPWWLAVYRAFGNPLYPYYNTIFHSPYYLDSNLFDTRFLPKTWLDWLTYPLEWSLRKSTRTSETPVRDLRILLEVLAALGLAIWAVAARLSGAGGRIERTMAPLWCAIFVIVSYTWWLSTFGILRYASVLETLSGVVVLSALALASVGIRPHLAWPRVAGALLVAALFLSTTVIPKWERRPDPGPKLIAADIPRVPADSVIVLLGPVEMAFLAPFEPASVRFIDINGNLVFPQRTVGIETLMAQAIDGATGPIWSISGQGPLPPAAEQSLQRFALRRTEDCRPVTSTIAPPLSLCRVERLPRG